MKTLLRLEECGIFALGIALYSALSYSWLLFAILLFTPDISMAAYAINDSIGALVYNIFHHRGIALALYFTGVFFDWPGMMLAGTILFVHSSLDRIFGYGLKFVDSFHHTHLGWFGKKNVNKPVQ